MSDKRALIVGIGGASSSGKTSIAKILHKIIPDSLILHQDDFYKNDTEIPIDEATGEANWDCPEAINFEDFSIEISYIRDHGDFSPPVKAYENRYNSDTNDSGQIEVITPEIEELKTAITDILSKKNRRLILVDGFMLFHDLAIVGLFDIKIFLRASYETLKYRREKRSGYQTQETFWVDPPGYFDNIVYPAYAESHKHLFIDNDVEKELKQDAYDSLDIKSYANNNGVTLDEVLLWALKSLSSELQKF